MDLGNSASAIGQDGRSTAELLADISAHVSMRRQFEVEEFGAIIAWADANVIETLEGAATITEGAIDTGIPVAGPGAPLVSDYALLELCATLERSPDGGRLYVGKIVECGWRLPGIRDAVLAGRVPVWKALRVAELTRPLSSAAAGHVDRNLAFALPTCSWAQVERLVAEAIDRHDPAAAEERRQDAADRRHVWIDTDEATDGVVTIDATLDMADARDLDTALNRRATVLGQLGCEESHDVRRAVALGELARHDLTLDLEIVDQATGEIRRCATGRKVELHVHLTDQAITGVGSVGRVGNEPVTVEQIRQWCGLEGGSIVIRPVIDLKDHVPVDSYEIPTRLKRRVRLRDHTCRAPFCNRKAERCDIDHATAHADGGPTCPCQLVPLCRKHHRAKTAGAWAYSIIDPGTYLWTGPHGRHWLVDHTGTRSIPTPRSADPAPAPPDWADPGWTEPTYGQP